MPEAYILATLRAARHDADQRLFFADPADQPMWRLRVAWLEAEIARRVVQQDASDA